MRVADPAAARRYRRFAATSRDALGRGLRKLAQETRGYGSRALRNDPGFYDQLSAVREAAAREFGQQMRGRVARSAADTAWHAGDWYRVSEAYSQIENDLSPAERQRLQYARRQLGDDA